jgi:peptidoglycan hydrolase CwlO-like protein
MPNRVVCSVLEEMRELSKTRNYGALDGLIEEAQSMVNRMEAALYDLSDIESYQQKASELNRELKKLRKERDALRTEIASLKGMKEE